MTSRVSMTLAVCLIGALIAAIMLFRPASDPLAGLTVNDTDAGSTGTSPTEPSTAATGPTIQIADFAFGGSLTVAAGTSVAVANEDGAPHSLTSSDGVFDTGVLDGGTDGAFTAPSAPGSYAVFCQIHPSMTAVVTVTS